MIEFPIATSDFTRRVFWYLKNFRSFSFNLSDIGFIIALGIRELYQTLSKSFLKQLIISKTVHIQVVAEKSVMFHLNYMMFIDYTSLRYLGFVKFFSSWYFIFVYFVELENGRHFLPPRQDIWKIANFFIY